MPLPPPNPPKPRINAATRDNIKKLISGVIDQIVARTGAGGPILPDPLAATGKRQKPFMLSLFPSLVKASEIERSLSTRMGNLMQLISVEIARQNDNEAEAQYTVSGQIAPGVKDFINHLRRSGRANTGDPPNLPNEITTMKNLNTGPMAPEELEIDVFILSGEKEYYFDLKTPSPNSEQPRDMKYRMMMVRALRLPNDVDAHAVFYYNPNGVNGAYTQGQVYLDYANGEVFVGKRYWDFLGGDGTYEELISIFQEVEAERHDELENLLL